MKKLIIALLILALPTGAIAGSQQIRQVLTMAKSSSSPTYLYDFEDSGTPTGITVVTGTPNFDATPTADMQGSESAGLLSCTDSSSKKFSTAVTDSGEIAVESELVVDSEGGTSGTDYYMTILDGATQLAIMAVVDNGSNVKLQVITYNVAGVSTVGTLSYDTKYKVRLYYKKGTGANAIARVAFVEGDGEFPTSGNDFAEITTGARTGNADTVSIESQYTSATNCYNLYADGINVVYY